MIPVALIGLAAQLAPALVRALTGSARAEAVAESVVGVVEAVTGQPARTEAEAAQAVRALQSDPAAWAQVQTALAGLAAREAELEHTDRADARERDVALRQAGQGNRRADALLAVVVLLLVACAAGMILASDEITRTFLAGLGGALIKMLSDAFAFEFGSSRGSAEKQRTIEAMAVPPAADTGAFRRG